MTWSPPADDELVLHGVELVDADISSRRFRYVSIGVGSVLLRCDFRGTRFMGGGLGVGIDESRYVDCNFDDCRLVNVSPGRASFVRCSFRNVEIKNFKTAEAQFIDCVFSGHLQTAVFTARPASREKLDRDRNEFRGNDFSAAVLRDVGFRGGIDLDLQRLPDDHQYLLIRDAHRLLRKAAAEVAKWSETDLREHAEMILDNLAWEAEDGQNDLFVERSFVELPIESGRERLVRLLSRLE